MEEKRKMAGLLRHIAAALLFLVTAASTAGASTYYASDPNLGSARVIFQLGCYNTNHFFRVDKGFVAQVADVMGGRKAPMNKEQEQQAEKSIVGEFSTVKHVRGILSMGRYSDPDSASSSFSILLGDAPHLDGQYAVFGRVTKGDDTLRKLERLPTHKEGIFAMPIERTEILSTYYYDIDVESCEAEKSILKRRLSESASEVERWRRKCFA
ncbi:peptidyl-prolyl cis-trans isomerase CYP23-like isoform X2 [Triticum dicoccoides]|uniref:peptidyl-prolyl cis-trans isomerase CYP23-like isoform X2 n=1 Tax=Triticum dicoccoides TaxID=85692 RepID=UPI00188F5966|nr:peptidyl-prolyl cis-trans isomerase CYP23-like isoform X2 [Triticum dicoccoides]